MIDYLLLCGHPISLVDFYHMSHVRHYRMCLNGRVGIRAAPFQVVGFFFVVLCFLVFMALIDIVKHVFSHCLAYMNQSCTYFPLKKIYI